MQRRILIVDDHDDLASALTEVFNKTGYLVKTTESRDEAVRLDEINGYDIVISFQKVLSFQKSSHTTTPIR